MADQQRAIVPAEESNWRPRVFLIGGLVGALLGLLSAYLYVRSVEETHGEMVSPSSPKASDAVKLGISLLGIIRTITDWGRR